MAADRQGTVTLEAALGMAEGKTLELNTFDAATCPRCGAEPRLHTHETAKGCTVAFWIPVEHDCARIRGLS